MVRLRWADICDGEGYDALDPWGCLHTESLHQEESGNEARTQKTNVKKEPAHASPQSLAASAPASSPEDALILVPVSDQKAPRVREYSSHCNCPVGAAEPQRAHATFWQPLTDASDLALRIEVRI